MNVGDAWTSNWSERRLMVLAAVLPVYLVATFYRYSSLPEDLGTLDAFLRWQEIRHVLAGIDPKDVMAGRVPALADVGAPRFSYAPWSYLLGIPFLPPVRSSLSLTWFVGMSLAALGAMSAAAWRQARPFGRRAGVAMVLAAGTTLAIPVGFRHLNYVAIVCGALAVFLLLEERKHHVLAGAALALGMLKPQLGALFVLVPLAHRSWRTLVSCLMVLGAATAGTSLLLGKSPVALVSAMVKEGAGYGDGYLGIFTPLLQVGATRLLVVGLGAIVGVVLVLYALLRYRPGLLDSMAIAACGATLWSYQRTFDLLVLGFLILALGRRALETGERRAWQVFWLVGATYWFPYAVRFSLLPVLPELFRAVWAGGCVFLLHTGARSEVAERAPAATQGGLA
ncbi:MAG: DUF2029 domain-containing protein [Anaeromyxobacter sp.]|nr:DUF2029 domain-containing protein [Anaeromyxobacter sp.]